MPPLTRLAQDFVAEALRPGDLAIDGTVGNGWDNVVSGSGRRSRRSCLGFDIQSAALERARARLADAKVDMFDLCRRAMRSWTGANGRRVRQGAGGDVQSRLSAGDGAGVSDDPGPITQPATTVAALRVTLEFTGGRRSPVGPLLSWPCGRCTRGEGGRKLAIRFEAERVLRGAKRGAE